MDKKDQHIDQVGNDENLFHDESLPPIWDDIAQELDAVDAVDSPIEDVVDLDSTIDDGHLDFASIKDGFVQTFQDKKPPKFTWDQIEQELESLSPTVDDPSDFSLIKAGFEQNYKESALPMLSWEDLADEMDNPTPKTPKEDYSFVKSGFEKQYSGVVLPLFSWNDLAERMDNEAALNDTADRYSSIKESFQKEHNKKVPPPFIWNNIQVALQKETLWGRVAYQFGNLLNGNIFSSGMLLVGAAGLLILNSRSCLLDQNITPAPIAQTIKLDNSYSNTPVDMDDIMNGVYSHSMKKQLEQGATVNRSIQLDETTDEMKMLADLLGMIEPNNEGNSKRKQSSVQQQSNNTVANNVSNSNTTTTGDKNNVKGGGRNIEVSTNSSIANNDLGNNAKDDSCIEPLNNNSNGSEDKNTTEPSINEVGAIIPTNNIENTTSTEDAIAGTEDLSNKQLFSTELGATWLNQPSIDAFLASDGLPLIDQQYVDDDAIPAMEDAAFTYYMQSMKRKKLRFEVGLLGRFGTSMLLGKTNKQAFSRESLISTDLRLGGAAGVQLNCFFTVNDALVFGFNPHSVAAQRFFEFSNDGAYTQTDFKLSSIDLSLGYQRTLFRYGDVERFPSKVYARLDLGLGYITKGEVRVDDKLVDLEDWYQKINWSAGLTLGTTHELDRILIDYGITANIGLNNVVNGAVNPAITIEPARLLNVGAYLGVRYVLFAKLKVVNRQRQFDWSPPFYVEEPSY